MVNYNNIVEACKFVITGMGQLAGEAAFPEGGKVGALIGGVAIIISIITTIVVFIVFYYVRLLGGPHFLCKGVSNVSIGKKVDGFNNIFRAIVVVGIFNRASC